MDGRDPIGYGRYITIWEKSMWEYKYSTIVKSDTYRSLNSLSIQEKTVAE